MPVISAEDVSLVEILHTAFLNEANTYARYAAYARKASAEGFRGVATLFRAAERSEQIHAGNHGRILCQLGGEADEILESVQPKTTLENLKAALAWELHEIDMLFPGFIRQAQAQKDMAAVRSFTWALEAEKMHARLLREALTQVEAGNQGSWATEGCMFYVCPVCGYTSECRGGAEMCPVCHCAWQSFQHVQ